MGGMGGGGGGMFNVPTNGAGMFNVAAKKTGDFKITTVCLEHGKPEPRSTVAYEIRPLETFTEKPGVYELLQALGYGQIDQRIAQAAAWNLNNGMSWATLAAKRIERADGDSYPYFSAQEIQVGVVGPRLRSRLPLLRPRLDDRKGQAGRRARLRQSLTLDRHAPA